MSYEYREITVYDYNCQSCGKHVTMKNTTLNCDACGKLLCRSCVKGFLCPEQYNELEAGDKSKVRLAGTLKRYFVLFIFFVAFMIYIPTFIIFAESLYENTVLIIIICVVIAPIISLLVGVLVFLHAKRIKQNIFEKYYGGLSKEKLQEKKVIDKETHAKYKAERKEKKKIPEVIPSLEEYKLGEYIDQRDGKRGGWFPMWIDEIDVVNGCIHCKNKGGVEKWVKNMKNIKKTDTPDKPF